MRKVKDGVIFEKKMLNKKPGYRGVCFGLQMQFGMVMSELS